MLARTCCRCAGKRYKVGAIAYVLSAVVVVAAVASSSSSTATTTVSSSATSTTRGAFLTASHCRSLVHMGSRERITGLIFRAFDFRRLGTEVVMFSRS